MKRKMVGAALALALVSTGAAVVRAERAEAKLPLPCHRVPTSRPYTYATLCRGILRRVEERLPDGTVRIIWPITTSTGETAK